MDSTKLWQFVADRLNQSKDFCSREMKFQYMDNAFGAVSFYCSLLSKPEDRAKIYYEWEEYWKLQFLNTGVKPQ